MICMDAQHAVKDQPESHPVQTLNDTVDPRPAYPAPLEPVPRIEVDPDAIAFDPTLTEPADINASPPPAPDDDDDLSAGVIVAIVLAIVILLLICLALCCLLLLRRRRRQQQQDMAVKDASAAGGNNGSQTNATATGGAISSLPWDKASLRVRSMADPGSLKPARSRGRDLASLLPY